MQVYPDEVSWDPSTPTHQGSHEDKHFQSGEVPLFYRDQEYSQKCEGGGQRKTLCCWENTSHIRREFQLKSYQCYIAMLRLFEWEILGLQKLLKKVPAVLILMG